MGGNYPTLLMKLRHPHFHTVTFTWPATSECSKDSGSTLTLWLGLTESKNPWRNSCTSAQSFPSVSLPLEPLLGPCCQQGPVFRLLSSSKTKDNAHQACQHGSTAFSPTDCSLRAARLSLKYSTTWSFASSGLYFSHQGCGPFDAIVKQVLLKNH